MNQPTKNSSQEETCVPMRPQTVRSGKLMRAVAFLCVGVLFCSRRDGTTSNSEDRGHDH